MASITYHGHACFTLEHEGCRAVIDPYGWGMVPGQPDLHLEAEAVYCSHSHGDHNFTDAVTLVPAKGPLPWTVAEFETPHDEEGGAKRGMNTVRIFHCGGIRIAHLGDIGCFPDENLAKALEGVDCMLIPVGGFFTVGPQTAWQIIRAAQPRVAVPMHYRTDDMGFDIICHIDDFVKLCGEVRQGSNTLCVTPETEKQILIMNHKS